MGFLAELRRRNVIRMAGLYLVGVWLLVQVAGTVLPMFGAPGWLPRSVVMLAALGFIPALIFAWVFEITPEGIKRDADVPLEASIAPHTARRMDRMIIAILAVALLYFGFDKFVLGPAREVARDAAREVATVNPVAQPPAKVAEPAISEKSIAVLPFADLSPGHDQEYFSDGMAEEILDALAQVQDLKVAGRTSSFYFKGKNENLQTIGKMLGVAHVLEGSVRKQGNKVRITVQLIQTRDGFHLWSESYDGDLKDVFALQEKIARSITDQLKPFLLGEQTSQLTQAGTTDAEAYQQYLRGRYFWSRRGLGNLQTAAVAFKAALAADPGYADAWAGLAQTYALITEYSVFDPGGSGRRIDTTAQALDAANRALSLDPASSRALAARAYVRCLYQFDWAGAEADYRTAVASDPRDAVARQWYGELLMYQRRWADADVQYKAAIALDPLVPVTRLSWGLSLWYRGDLEAALSAVDESVRLQPDFYNGSYIKMMILAQQRRFDEARAAAHGLPASEQTMTESFVAGIQDPAKTDAGVAQVLAHGPGGIIGKPVMLSILGKDDLALAEIERLSAQRDPYQVFLYAIPQFKSMYGNQRFRVILKKIGLPRDGGEP